ncbi:hypothetical protein FQR65_LT01803 [Abscondita terminalis]|nr:hypothetical protein FQR65_LT01803 [Abscondita terminalis]
MKLNTLLCFVLLLLIHNTTGLEHLLNTEIQKCLNCLCHARSGCWSRFNCARYSISKDYWIQAGSHSIAEHENEDVAYKNCMNDENCILNTVKSYTEGFGLQDCNCDGQFDCKDRFAIHLFGSSCFNPTFGDVYADRFNDCAKQIGVKLMSKVEGDCSLETFT